jgi:integrase
VRRVSVVRAASGATVGDVWGQYVADRLLDGKQAPQFADSWKALAPRFASLPVDAITADVCRDYTRQRIASGVSQGTVWTELTKLRSCINWAVKRRVIPSAPYVWIPSKPAPKQRVLTPDEAIRLLDACVMPHVRLFIVLALTTGARSAAITGLTWDRVDLERRTIDLREPEVIDPLTKRVRKGRSIVPMTDAARAALQEAKAGSLSPYVIEWDGEPIAKVRKGFMAAAARAGLADVTPHTLRHTSASWMASAGVEMEQIARHLGHRDPMTTRTVYSKPEVESLRPGADVIDLRLKRKG